MVRLGSVRVACMFRSGPRTSGQTGAVIIKIKGPVKVHARITHLKKTPLTGYRCRKLSIHEGMLSSFFYALTKNQCLSADTGRIVDGYAAIPCGVCELKVHCGQGEPQPHGDIQI